MVTKQVVDFIQKHNTEYINYCETVILPKGIIEYAEPSHIYKLEMIWGVPREELFNGGVKYEELKKKMPVEASTVHWLCANTRCVVTWFNYVLFPLNYTKNQVDTVKELIRQGSLSKQVAIEISVEDLLTRKNITVEQRVKVRQKGIETQELLQHTILNG